MPSISDFSDDPKFTIKSVSAQTGILPVTLRAWERRHEVLNPQRADNKYRLYSERDIAILRWLKSRVDDGISISNAIKELRGMIREGQWPDAVPAAPTGALTRPTIPPATYSRLLYEALIKHDEDRTSDILREIHGFFDLRTILLEVMTPALVLIGEAWYRGEIRVTTEHFASGYLRGKLLTLLQAYPARRNLPGILIGGAPTEQHEIGTLMLAVLLRSEGYRVEYLGPDLPLEDLADYASYERPGMIVLSSTLESSARELIKFPAMLKKLRLTPLFGFGGAAFNDNPALRRQIDGHFLGKTLDEAVETITTLLEDRKRQRA